MIKKCHNIRHAMANNSNNVAQHAMNMKGMMFIKARDLL